jgi:hypothetical protein
MRYEGRPNDSTAHGYSRPAVAAQLDPGRDPGLLVAGDGEVLLARGRAAVIATQPGDERDRRLESAGEAATILPRHYGLGRLGWLCAARAVRPANAPTGERFDLTA